jgi:hypothetical protein
LIQEQDNTSEFQVFLNDATLLEAALAYASYRFHVFPCAPAGKQPATGRGGFKQCSSRPSQIKTWWKNNPNYNIGIALRYSTLAVVDIDPRNDGDNTLKEFEEQFGKLPPTFSVRTGSGGRHYYYRVPDDTWYEENNLPKALGPGLEFMTNGYVVAPPSRLTEGGLYSVTRGELIEDDFGTVPNAWLNKAARAYKVKRYAESWRPEDENWFLSKGERDDGLTKFAGYLRRVGLTGEEIEAMLQVILPDHVEDGESAEIRAAVKRISHGMANYPPDKIGFSDITLNLKTRQKSPELDEKALYGVLGDWIRYIEPMTEVHPAALLAQGLATFGSLVAAKETEDAGPGFDVEDQHHTTGLYVLLIGESAKAGKGDSWARVKHLMTVVDPKWHCYSGVQTGEGLIDLLADDQEEEDSTVINGRRVQHKRKGGSHGSDRRCFVFEPEFGRTLHTLSRKGNQVLKDVLRELFDTGTTAKLTMQHKQTVSGVTLSFVGHITKPELERDFDPVDAMSGFGNRFLCVHAHRTKSLPSARSTSGRELAQFIQPLQEAIRFAQKAPEDFGWSEEAWQLWCDVYPGLTQKHPNEMVDALSARGRPLVRRMSICYALTDCSDRVELPHLEAALALWAYHVQTIEYVWGSRLGNRDADSLIRALTEHTAGLSATQITQDIFKGRISGEALRSLVKYCQSRGFNIQLRRMRAGRTKPTDIYILRQEEIL